MGIISDIGLEILRLVNKITIRPSKEIAKVVKIYDAMHKILESNKVERVLVLKAHNGGGLIRPNTPLYVSAIYEDYIHPFTSVRDTYQKVSIDEHYIRTLMDLCSKKSIKIKTKNLPQSLQKDIYEGEGILYSEMFYLGQDKKNVYFCTCASSREDGWENDKAQSLLINMSINSIKNNIK